MPLKFLKKISIPSKISTYLSRSLIIITIATTLLIGGVMIIQQTIHFKKISQQRSREYIDNQKIYIQILSRMNLNIFVYRTRSLNRGSKQKLDRM